MLSGSPVPQGPPGTSAAGSKTCRVRTAQHVRSVRVTGRSWTRHWRWQDRARGLIRFLHACAQRQLCCKWLTCCVSGRPHCWSAVAARPWRAPSHRPGRCAGTRWRAAAASGCPAGFRQCGRDRGSEGVHGARGQKAQAATRAGCSPAQARTRSRSSMEDAWRCGCVPCPYALDQPLQVLLTDSCCSRSATLV